MKNVSFIVTGLKLQWLTFSLLVLTGCTEIKATKSVRTGMWPNRKTISSYFLSKPFPKDRKSFGNFIYSQTKSSVPPKILLMN